VQPVIQTRVYPNPYAQVLHLRISSPEQEPAAVKIIDMLGRVVYASSNHRTNEEITLGNHLKPGPYLLQVVCKSGMEVVRIVKTE
jgi:hypothetical protein